MRVDPAKNFRLIFTLNPDSEIGPVIEPYVVQLNSNDSLSLTYQKLYDHTMKAFTGQMDEDDIEIIRLSTEYAIENITRKFCKKDIRPHEFISKFLDEKLLKDSIRPYVEDRIVKCMALLKDKPMYIRGKSGNPAHKQLEYEANEVSVFFHFIRGENGTQYYPTFKCGEDKLSFVNKNVLLVTNQPCILLSENRLYHFSPELEGKKLTPFFSKWNIDIPKQSEPQYFRRFISQLIEKHKVIAKGFDIFSINNEPLPQLKMEMGWNNQPQLLLYFDYKKEKIASGELKQVHVRLERNNDQYTYFRINRNMELEKGHRKVLENMGLEFMGGSSYMPKNLNGNSGISELVEWVNVNKGYLSENGFQILQDDIPGNYYLGEIKLDLSIEENNDWFDVFAIVSFGDYKIPFVKLKKYILGKIPEFVLPDGKIAIIPKEWFTMYKDLLALSGGNDDSQIIVKKHHFALVNDLFQQTDANNILKKDLYLSYTKIQENNIQPPKRFLPILRPYQADGFRWMLFLKENKFGGCLADDMGLGKTIQTLSLLEYDQEHNGHDIDLEDKVQGQLSLFGEEKPLKTSKKKSRTPSLIIMPTSLIHNWQLEVKKWAPSLRTVVYTGLDRGDKLKDFLGADLILTTYGTARNDIDLLKNFKFNYIILDESQMIKNPMAKVSKAVKSLNARHRLALSGTPIENSLTDLWSQMSFLNPGLLGSYQFFRDEFAYPIEKRADEDRKQKLKTLIQPFILRRTKEQVARDLPELTEKHFYSEMSPEQKEIYVQTRNFYRRKILESMEQWGEKRAQFFILRGLMQLRLIANHPSMQDSNFDGTSGKFEDITSSLESILSDKHRVLVFSQFVRHLDLIAAWLNKQNIPYSYLTGQTRKRAEAVKGFREDPSMQVFLISLKAGGVGLNLTEADYVFMCDPWWNPAAEQQAINRAHRIGQDKKVFAYKFISKDTVEEKILLLQEKKLALSADLIRANTGFDKAFSKSDIEMLFS